MGGGTFTVDVPVWLELQRAARPLHWRNGTSWGQQPDAHVTALAGVKAEGQTQAIRGGRRSRVAELLMSRGEATFHLNDKVNRRKVRARVLNILQPQNANEVNVSCHFTHRHARCVQRDHLLGHVNYN